MKKYLCTLLTLLSILVISETVYAAEQNTLPSGMNYSEIEGNIDTYVLEHEKTTAAVSISIYSADKVLFEKAYGYTDLENKIANTPMKL